MAAVAVVMAQFYVTVIVATRQVVGVSSPGDVVLMLLVDDVGSSLHGLDGSLGGLGGSFAARQQLNNSLSSTSHAWSSIDTCVHMHMQVS